MKDKVLNMYYIGKKKQIEIANQLNISKYKVSRIVRNDSRFNKEKQDRKLLNKKKHIENTKNYINKKRKVKSDIDYAILKKQHEQASRELSVSTNYISNRALKKWNSSAYKYNKKDKSYVLRKEIIAGSDIPRSISWKNY